MTSVGCRRAGRRRESGASLVEFALIVPLLVMILLGTVTGGFALATKNSMTNAVREGARLGATLPKGASWNAWADAVATRVADVAGDDLPKSQVCVAMVRRASPANTVLGTYPAASCSLNPSMATPAVPPSAPAGTCVVLVWGTRSATLETVVYSFPLELKAKAVGRYERTECT